MPDEHGVTRKYKFGYSRKFSERWERMMKLRADGFRKEIEDAAYLALSGGEPRPSETSFPKKQNTQGIIDLHNVS